MALTDALKVYKELRVTAARIVAHRKVWFSDAIPLRGVTFPIFADLRIGRSPKGLYGDEAREGRTQVLTYNKAKGREFDYVMLVVDPRQESTRPPLSERRRLYYVCATRPRKWLGVVYCGNDKGNVLGPVLSA
jgi:superfamily I DNA/RNA helicase